MTDRTWEIDIRKPMRNTRHFLYFNPGSRKVSVSDAVGPGVPPVDKNGNVFLLELSPDYDHKRLTQWCLDHESYFETLRTAFYDDDWTLWAEVFANSLTDGLKD